MSDVELTHGELEFVAGAAAVFSQRVKDFGELYYDAILRDALIRGINFGRKHPNLSAPSQRTTEFDVAEDGPIMKGSTSSFDGRG